MGHTVFSDYYKYFGQAIAHYQREDYTAALEQLDHTQNRFPGWRWMIDQTRACIAAKQGDHELALALLGDALDGGHWLPEQHWDDSDFDALRATPAFQRLRERSAAQRLAAQAQAQPELLIRLPRGGSAEPFPMLIGLHGHCSTASEVAEFWYPATQHGWLVGVPQAAEMYAPGTFTWGETEASRSRQEHLIRSHVNALRRAYPVDEQRIVFGGFSLGAELAVKLTLEGAVAACGFIAVAAGGMISDWNAQQWQPLIEAARGRDVRGTIIVGEQDSPRLVEHSTALAELLGTAGFTCELELHPDLAHEFPPDFDHHLKRILATFDRGNSR